MCKNFDKDTLTWLGWEVEHFGRAVGFGEPVLEFNISGNGTFGRVVGINEGGEEALQSCVDRCCVGVEGERLEGRTL